MKVELLFAAVGAEPAGERAPAAGAEWIRRLRGGRHGVIISCVPMGLGRWHKTTVCSTWRQNSKSRENWIWRAGAVARGWRKPAPSTGLMRVIFVWLRRLKASATRSRWAVLVTGKYFKTRKSMLD